MGRQIRLTFIHVSIICKNTKPGNKCTVSLWEISHKSLSYYTTELLENDPNRQVCRQDCWLFGAEGIGGTFRG